ncbi:hypothetical protein DNTS_003295 [Danionella cerebrum]|uniref:MICOS complex subunit n=1 Tax=Danionella cerebrum TaxID=2873325 RepID=A0A553MVK0_9TELE|nr:hypothetical protein DNTS_003295 [Danionella translucida]
MYKFAGFAGATGALGLRSGSVFAATAEDEPRKTLNIDELSLYSRAQLQHPAEHQEPERGQIEGSIAVLRELAQPSLSWCQGVYGAVKPRVTSAVQFGQNSYGYLKNPPAEFYPRAAVITFTGILGVFLGRGSKLKRVIYSTGLMTVATSLYYPQEAVSVTKRSGDRVYEWMLQAYVSMEKLVKNTPKDHAEQSSNEETKS